MKKIITVCLSLFFYSNNLKAQWQEIFKDSATFSFTCVHFINNDTGFVGGFYDAGVIHCGAILRTTNGGLSWDTSLFLGGYTPMSIQFLNDTLGYGGGQDGFIIQTVDAGENWQFVGGSCCNDISSIYFFNKDSGIAIDFFGNTMATYNSMQTWSYLNNTTGCSHFPGTSKYFYVDSNLIYLAHSRKFSFSINCGALERSFDNGITWTALPLPNDFYPFSCYFFNSNKGIVVDRVGKVSKTIDGGLTWSLPDSLGRFPLYDIDFVSDSIGYIVGGTSDYDSFNNFKGVTYKTIDQGNSWQLLDSSLYNALTKLYFPSDSVGYAVGLNGIVLKITNANSISSNIQNLSSNNNSSVLFPNPFSNELNFSDKTIRSVKIMDTLGKLVLNSNYIQTINTLSWRKGFYFYELETTAKDFKRGKIIKQ